MKSGMENIQNVVHGLFLPDIIIARAQLNRLSSFYPSCFLLEELTRLRHSAVVNNYSLTTLCMFPIIGVEKFGFRTSLGIISRNHSLFGLGLAQSCPWRVKIVPLKLRDTGGKV